MKAIAHLLRSRLNQEPMDAWLSLWGCMLGGFMLPLFAAVTLLEHASSRQELVLGVAAAGIVGLLLVLLGCLARQVHLSSASRANLASWFKG